ncbi:MAG: nucleotidyl transferase AbiEii/AbiGii toxin family protein [Anaerovoracaceae bacterium]
MIHTSIQLKALVRNKSNSNSNKAQMLIRNFMMERFIDRLSRSEYKDNIILKGGFLIATIVGFDLRSTVDLDATIKGEDLSISEAKKIVETISNIEIDDGISFEIQSAKQIMEGAEYPGVRINLDVKLDSMITPIQIDFSTGDIITPKEIEYSFLTMFDEERISVLAYNNETILAEKLEAIISRGKGTTRMRDFYDIYVFETYLYENIDYNILRDALIRTAEKRDSTDAIINFTMITLQDLKESEKMNRNWKNFQRKFEFAQNISFDNVILALERLYNHVNMDVHMGMVVN